MSSSIIQITIEPPGHFEAADRDGGLRDKDHQQPEVLDGQDKDEATLYSCSKCRLKVETKVRLKKHKEETHRIFQCDECDKKCSSSKGLKFHKEDYHNNINNSGKRKFVESLVQRPLSNKISTSAGFMVVSNEASEDEREEHEEGDNPGKKKKKTLSERLKEPIKVKKDNRSSQTNINSFRNQFLTMKKKASRLQREVGSEPDFVLIMKNNLQDPKTSNASASAGKYLIYGEGKIRDKLLQSGIQFVAKEMFLLANNVDFTEEVIATRAEESEVWRTPTNVVEEEVVSKSVTKKRRDDVKGQMNSEKRGVFGARKVRTPGFIDYSSSSGSTSSDDSTENALSGEKLDIN